MFSTNENFLFFLRTPHLMDLLSLALMIDAKLFLEKGKTLFHLRILKCRELIFTEPVIASPKLPFHNEIMCVVPKRRFSSSDFTTRLNKMGLIVKDTKETDLNDLQECIRYTIIAKMAPTWNHVQNTLVQGRDFLSSSEPLNAINLDVIVSRNEIHLSLKASCVKIPQLKINHFENSQFFEELERNGNTASIQLNEMFYILPSLRKAKVVSISSFLSEQCFYKSYLDFKKHWKNMYGYRLPDLTTDRTCYLNVQFKSGDPTIYTYPMCCVRPFGMILVPRVDPKGAVQLFLSEFCKKMGNICGEKCQILELKAAFPALEIYSYHRWKEEVNPRIGTTYNMPKGAPYKRDLIKLKKDQEKQQMNSISTLSGQASLPIPVQAENMVLNRSISSTQIEKYVPKFYPKIQKNPFESNVTKMEETKKYIPKFSSKQTVRNLPENISSCSPTAVIGKINKQVKIGKLKQSTLLESDKFNPKIRKVILDVPKKKPKKNALSKKVLSSILFP